MIREVSGDILLSQAHAIAHGVAPNDDFHSGLALALRQKWPAMYRDFRHWCHLETRKCGEAWTWGGPNVRIVALLRRSLRRAPDNTRAAPACRTSTMPCASYGKW